MERSEVGSGSGSDGTFIGALASPEGVHGAWIH